MDSRILRFSFNLSSEPIQRNIESHTGAPAPVKMNVTTSWGSGVFDRTCPSGEDSKTTLVRCSNGTRVDRVISPYDPIDPGIGVKLPTARPRGKIQRSVGHSRNSITISKSLV